VLTDDILSRSAADIVTLYRSKRLSPVDVLTAMLDRIDRLDRLYNVCEIPSTLGTNNMALGHNAATNTESWPAAAIISRVENWRACALLLNSAQSVGSNVTG
jgi:hypothetical protein